MFVYLVKMGKTGKNVNLALFSTGTEMSHRGIWSQRADWE